MDGELKQEYVLPVTASKSGLVFMDVYDMNVRGEYSSGHVYRRLLMNEPQKKRQLIEPQDFSVLAPQATPMNPLNTTRENWE